MNPSTPSPESETPETDSEEFEIPPIGALPARKVVEAWIARSLERRLSLAQTEIKGLQAERDLHYTRLAGLLFSGALDKYTGGDVQSWAAEYTKNLTEAQARIAELEKDAARYRFIRSPTSGDFGVELIFDTAKHPQLRTRGNVDMAVDAAIDATIKDRA